MKIIDLSFDNQMELKSFDCQRGTFSVHKTEKNELFRISSDMTKTKKSFLGSNEKDFNTDQMFNEKILIKGKDDDRLSLSE